GGERGVAPGERQSREAPRAEPLEQLIHDLEQPLRGGATGDLAPDLRELAGDRLEPLLDQLREHAANRVERAVHRLLDEARTRDGRLGRRCLRGSCLCLPPPRGDRRPPARARRLRLARLHLPYRPLPPPPPPERCYRSFASRVPSCSRPCVTPSASKAGGVTTMRDTPRSRSRLTSSAS